MQPIVLAIAIALPVFVFGWEMPERGDNQVPDAVKKSMHTLPDSLHWIDVIKCSGCHSVVPSDKIDFEHLITKKKILNQHS